MSRATATRLWPWVALGVILLGTAAIRVRLLDVPLDRDEGEYAYMAQLLLQGVPPYVGAYSMKMPGIYAVYALILTLFGSTPAGIHGGLAAANAVTVVLVFLLARRLYGPLEAVTAAAVLALLTLDPETLGLAAYAEHFVLVPVLAGVLVLLRGLETRRATLLFGAGVLFGAGFLLKQSATLFVAWALVWVVVDHLRVSPRRWRSMAADVAAVAAGALVPFALVCGAYTLVGAFGSLWFWTFRYASEYVSAVPLIKGIRHFAFSSRDLVRSMPFLAAAAAAGAFALAKDPSLRERRAFVAVFATFSFLAVTPGLYFRNQYYILVLPALALAAAVLPATAMRLCAARPRVAVGLAAVLVVVPPLATVWTERFVLLQATPMRVSRTIYGRNPFPESLAVADYVKRHTTPDDTIVVVGSEPQIYFYAGRRGATAYIYMYPLMEEHRFAAEMQRQMIGQIEAGRPKFLVYVNIYTSWLARPDSDQTILRWLGTYARQFERVGVVDIVSADHTRYVWDEAAQTYAPDSQRWLTVWRRRGDAP